MSQKVSALDSKCLLSSVHTNGCENVTKFMVHTTVISCLYHPMDHVLLIDYVVRVTLTTSVGTSFLLTHVADPVMRSSFSLPSFEPWGWIIHVFLLVRQFSSFVYSKLLFLLACVCSFYVFFFHLENTWDIRKHFLFIL